MAGSKEWMRERENLALIMAIREASNKDPRFFDFNDKTTWKAKRAQELKIEQQRLYFLSGYIDDSHMMAVGDERTFRLLVCFVTIGVRANLLFSGEKFAFGQHLRVLGFYEDVSNMRITIPEEKLSTTIAWLREAKIAKSMCKEEFNSLVHTLVSLNLVIRRGRHHIGRFFRAMSKKWGKSYNRRGNRILITPNLKEHIDFWIGALSTSTGSELMGPKKRLRGNETWMSDACRCLDEGKPTGAGGFLPVQPGYYWSVQFHPMVEKWLKIHHLECAGCLMNSAVFGPFVKNHTMVDECDNQSVVEALQGSPPADMALGEMALKRLDLNANNNIETLQSHFPGWMNVLTDHLSRDRLEEFLKEAARRGFLNPVKLDTDASLLEFFLACATMIRDHDLPA